jgi:hypothetical protein
MCPGAVNGELMERVIAARAQAEGRAPEEIIRTAYTDVAALRAGSSPRRSPTSRCSSPATRRARSPASTCASTRGRM